MNKVAMTEMMSEFQESQKFGKLVPLQGLRAVATPDLLTELMHCS